MKIVSLHGDGSPHRIWPVVEQTPDPWCFIIPAGGSVVEANGRAWSSDYPVVAVFWPERYYQVFILLKQGHTEYYCNVISPPTWFYATSPLPMRAEFSDGLSTPVPGVWFHDLDLDVYVDAEGIRVLDEDEFSSRQTNYSPQWVAAAQSAVEELRRLATAHKGPFAPNTAQFWRWWVGQGKYPELKSALNQAENTLNPPGVFR
ncbi:DUF402 domain-containing protein [Alicyclobacillaceae bacterium I2511]|nr:DUF402 domain-containing protein [Alicyclobacillaceae bacterium I2511]